VNRKGLSHYDSASYIPGATLEKWQRAVNKEHHDLTKKLDLELHGTQGDQRGPIESELSEHGHSGRVLAPVIGRTRSRTNTNPNDTEANAAGRSVRACVARKSKS